MTLWLCKLADTRNQNTERVLYLKISYTGLKLSVTSVYIGQGQLPLSRRCTNQSNLQFPDNSRSVSVIAGFSQHVTKWWNNRETSTLCVGSLRGRGSLLLIPGGRRDGQRHGERMLETGYNIVIYFSCTVYPPTMIGSTVLEENPLMGWFLPHFLFEAWLLKDLTGWRFGRKPKLRTAKPRCSGLYVEWAAAIKIFTCF